MQTSGSPLIDAARNPKFLPTKKTSSALKKSSFSWKSASRRAERYSQRSGQRRECSPITVRRRRRKVGEAAETAGFDVIVGCSAEVGQLHCGFAVEVRFGSGAEKRGKDFVIAKPKPKQGGREVKQRSEAPFPLPRTSKRRPPRSTLCSPPGGARDLEVAAAVLGLFTKRAFWFRKILTHSLTHSKYVQIFYAQFYL